MATKLIFNQWGRPAHSMHVLPMLGIPAGGHLPKEGMPPREVQGVTVWVEPAKPTVMGVRWGRPHIVKSSTHRIMCKCSGCGKTVSLGRLAQHAKTHDKE